VGVWVRAPGGQFEIATYPNTVVTWRTGAEKDVREVLQIDRVFRSVEQGEYAKSKDLQKCFGTDDQAAICLEILKAGEIQLTEKERGSQQESLLKEICTMVAERCVNSQSKRPVTVGVVERALAELHFNVDRNKNAKKQALEAIKLLEGKYPIERLPMNLKITFPQAAKAEAREKMAALGAIFDREDDRCAAHRKEAASIACTGSKGTTAVEDAMPCHVTCIPHLCSDGGDVCKCAAPRVCAGRPLSCWRVGAWQWGNVCDGVQGGA
jgi:ribosome maturation protein SDO1